MSVWEVHGEEEKILEKESNKNNVISIAKWKENIQTEDKRLYITALQCAVSPCEYMSSIVILRIIERLTERLNGCKKRNAQPKSLSI